MANLEPTLADLEVDRGASAGERAAYAGVLQDICKYITFTELKGLRRVCRAWFDVITPLPRMANCTGKFGNDWAREASGMDYQRCIQFRSVYFRFFQFQRNPVFNPYWNFIGGQNVTKLKFKFARMPCNKMVEFLQGCPNLQEVYFDQCNFHLLEYKIVASKTKDAPSNIHRTCCTHVNGLADLTLVGTPIPPQIHTVQFKGQNFFPLCVLDLLIQRSTGVLRKFGFSEALFIQRQRSRYLPSKNTIEARMQAWIFANRETITSFTWLKIHRGDQFLERLITGQVILANVLEVVIGQKARKPSWDNMDTYIHFLNFVRTCCGPNVRTLHVRLTQRFRSERLTAALETKAELRTLKLEGMWVVRRPQEIHEPLLRPSLPVDISEIVGRCPHLEALELWDFNQKNQPSMTHNYLPNMPHTLKNLKFFNFYMPIADVATYISSVRAKQLKTLNIESGRLFTNAMMETVIQELPQLEEFGVSNSTLLTDAGLTGLTEQAVRTMITCKSGILYSCERLETPGGPLKISQLKKLRKLSFCMSQHVSDISIFLGFKFHELREINLSWCRDVTDVGLIWLARNNPALERIVLMKNRKITHYGLNNLITQFPTIKNIHTSRSCRDRKMGKQLNYVENPRFHRVVSYDKWSHKPPGELGND